MGNPGDGSDDGRYGVDPDIGPRLARYVAGRSSPAEAAEVEAWIAAVPGRAALVESFRQTWALARAPRYEAESDAAWVALRARVEGRRPAHPRLRRALRPAVPAWALAAAAVIALVLGGVGVWFSFSGPPAGPSASRAAREFATRRGQIGNLRLPDGTRVILNVDTRLLVPDGYGRPVREVQVDGEAFFDVRHDPERPFRVRVSGATAEVLGTRFGVRRYEGDTAAVVAVEQGEVRLAPAVPRASLVPPVLGAGQLGTVEADGRVKVRSNLDLDAGLGWIDGRLIFRATTLRAAAPHLSRWYDIDVRLADDEVGELRLTASFKDESVLQVMDLIALSLDIQYTHDGRTVVFWNR